MTLHGDAIIGFIAGLLIGVIAGLVVLFTQVDIIHKKMLANGTAIAVNERGCICVKMLTADEILRQNARKFAEFCNVLVIPIMKELEQELGGLHVEPDGIPDAQRASGDAI